MCDTPSHGSDHLWLIWKESIQNCRCYRADTAGGTDGRTDPQNGVLWLLLSINLGAFFLCGYWVLCGCVCMSRPTKRCLVATFVHKFGCLFSCVAIGFVWLQINKIATKVPTVPKNSHRSGVFVRTNSPYMGTWTQMIITCVFFCFSPYMDTWTHKCP